MGQLWEWLAHRVEEWLPTRNELLHQVRVDGDRELWEVDCAMRELLSQITKTEDAYRAWSAATARREAAADPTRRRRKRSRR